MYWLTMYGWPSSSPTSKIVTMFGVVAELRHRLRFALHARESLRVEAVRLDHGDGDIALQLLVVREIDALASAFAQEATHGVAATGEG